MTRPFLQSVFIFSVPSTNSDGHALNLEVDANPFIFLHTHLTAIGEPDGRTSGVQNCDDC